MIAHLITNFAVRNGAESMLARLLRIGCGNERTLLVSLMTTSRDTLELLDGTGIEPRALGATSPRSAAAATLRLARLMKRERPRIVMCWMYHAAIAGTLARRLSNHSAGLIWNLRQSLDSPASFSRSTRTAVALASRLSAQADTIVYNSHRACELHGARGFDARNAIVIPNGFTVPDTPPPPPSVARRFGIAGRFHPQKDHETFLRALRLVRDRRPDLSFRAVGRGMTPANRELAALMARCGVEGNEVELAGEQDDMDAFYASIDALVLSSRTEGFPNVIGEAMARGRPCVTTDVGDAAQIVGDTGLVVAPQDPHRLADAILSLAALDTESYAACARAAHAKIRREFSIERVAARYAQLIAGDRLAPCLAMPATGVCPKNDLECAPSPGS